MPPIPVAQHRSHLLDWIRTHGPDGIYRPFLTNPKALDGALRRLLGALREAEDQGTEKGDATTWPVKRRVAANMEALRVFQRLHRSGNDPTAEERAALRSYSGWGGIDPATLSTDPGIPPEINAAIKDWHDALKERRVPSSPVFSTLVDQFFTPLSASRAMWSLARRATSRPFQYALEPSAGIGRLLQAKPKGMGNPEWTLVEMDPFLAQMAQVIWPTAAVHEKRFEQFVAEALPTGAQYDLILMNPPYSAWGKAGQRFDPEMTRVVSDTQGYFAARALDLLAPGGVLVALTTAGMINGRSEPNRTLRRYMLDRAVFAGAALVTMDLFGKLGAKPANGLSVHVWVKLPEGARAQIGYSEVERIMLPGGYFTHSEAGKNSLVGRMGKNQYGDDAPVGPFSEEALTGIPLAPLPDVFPQWEAVVRPSTKTSTSRPTGASSPKPTPKGSQGTRIPSGLQTLRDAAEEVPSLEMRLAEYYAAYQGSPEAKERAAEGRAELAQDLVDFVGFFGPPDTVPAVPATGWIRRVFQADGTLHPSLGTASLADVGSKPVLTSPGEAIRWYSRRSGQCTEMDLAREFPDASLVEVVLDDADLAVEVIDGNAYGFDKRDYLSGNLYTRRDRVDALLAILAEDASTFPPEMKAQLETQRGWLVEAIVPRTLAQIDARPNSGFVPTEAISAFCNEELCRAEPPLRIEVHKAEGRYFMQTHGALERNKNLHARDAKSADAAIKEARRTDLVFLLGYLNRETMVSDPDEKEAAQTSRYKSTIPEERQAEDQALEQRFALWLARSDRWRPIVEEQYNRAFRADHLRDYPTDPLPILRLNTAKRKPHGHQWSAARRAEDRGSMLLNWSVGAGKTIGAITSLARLRQVGRARRPLVVMPNPILSTWIAEVARTLPNYRVGVIGLTYDPEARIWRSDSGHTEERRRKWARFQAGGYDILLCTRSAFLRDVTVSTQATFDMLSRVEWIQRGLGRDEEQRKLLERRIEAARAKIKATEAEIKASEARLAKTPEPSTQILMRREIHRLTAKVAELNRQIAAWEADSKEPSKTVLANLQRMIQDRVEGGIFRPRDADGQPVEALATWEDLGVDLAIVDEAHGYKNLYYPGGRYGAESIAFMGSKRWSDDWTDFTIQAWDLFTKTATLQKRTGGRGVILLSATPVVNSPLEVYNIFAYLSPDIWSSRQIQSGEEWIDRYVMMQPENVTTADGGLRTEMAVLGFNEVNLPELQDLFRLWMYRLTTEDLVRLQLIPADALPEGKEIPAMVTLDPVQRALYTRVWELIRIEDKIAEIAKIPPAGALNFTAMDMSQKVATDPRLLVEDIYTVAKLLTLDEWLKQGATGKPPSFVVEYPMPETEEGVDEEAIHDVLTKAGIPLEVMVDGPAILGPGAKAPKASKTSKAGVESKRLGLPDVQRKNLERRYLFLLSLGLDRVNYDAQTGNLPPKYIELCNFIQKYPNCGHLIFSDYNLVQDYLREALVLLAGIDASRIATLTGEVSPEDREQIALDFNGQVEEVHPTTGAILVPAREARYDILIGNTKVMGEGLNLQTRTCGIHHMDLPWTPAGIQQRNGRGVRQGNANDTVFVRYYLGRATMDTHRKATVVGKATWQEALLSGASAGSIEMTPESAEEILAERAGSPERAAEIIAEARAAKAARERERLVREVTRDFQALVQVYHGARRTTAPQDRMAQLGIGDRIAGTLRPKLAKLGIPETLLREARARVVWLEPNQGFWLLSGEKVALRSSDARDGAYYSQPIFLEVQQIGVAGGMARVRRYGDPSVHSIFLPPNTVTKALLDPGKLRASAVGSVERIPGAVPWDMATEWSEEVLPKIAASHLGSIARGWQYDASFLTPDRMRAIWNSTLTFLDSTEASNSARWKWYKMTVNPESSGDGQDWPLPVLLDTPVDGRTLLLVTSPALRILSEAGFKGVEARKALRPARILSPVDAGDMDLFAQAIRSGQYTFLMGERSWSGGLGGLLVSKTYGGASGDQWDRAVVNVIRGWFSRYPLSPREIRRPV